ncbi:MAG: hypothetical protein JSV42_03955 [Chloroflexota bacterium]|nr:MAG: hypothetical protein JSV42_03955 [Chloroflexota bacterium]
MNKTKSQTSNGKFRTRLGMVIMLVGFVIFLIGAVPDLFGLDRSPVIGFVQITVFLIGLAFICLGGYISMNALWNNHPKTILADIGLRLVSTGFVIAAISGLADVFGFGTQISPQIPYYGPWQAMGVLVGEIVIILGFIFLIPFRIEPKDSDPPTNSKKFTEPSSTEIVFE